MRFTSLPREWGLRLPTSYLGIVGTSWRTGRGAGGRRAAGEEVGIDSRFRRRRNFCCRCSVRRSSDQEDTPSSPHPLVISLAPTKIDVHANVAVMPLRFVATIGIVALTAQCHGFVTPSSDGSPSFLTPPNKRHGQLYYRNADDPGSNSDLSQGVASAMDVRSFLTQRCIQSFMYLLVSTRDVHTVWWLDKVVNPVIVNNYWVENEEAFSPGDGGSAYENDQRYVDCLRDAVEF